MQNMKNQVRGSGMDARSNPANVSDGLQNSSGHIGTNTRYRLTKLGEQMARLPIDPKIARILLAAKKHDCMAEILVIASALSIQDPRERPLEARDAAAKAHERFTDKQSDFLAYLNIWDSFQRERDKGLSNKQLVQWCRQYFLSHLRMREWRELHHQLAQTAIEMGLTTKEVAFRRPPEIRQLTSSENQGDQDLSAKLKQKQLDKKQHRAQIRAAKEAGYEQIHRALLTGLIANVGMKSPDGNDYTGARGSRFHLFPASALFKAKPKWVMAAELVETTRLYARDVAVIQPEWIEQEAPHLVRYHYFEPHWEQKRGEVVASERVTLYGLTVLPRRPVSYGKVAPEEAREIFIRSALVAQECDLKADFFVHNKKLIKEITELEHKSRKQDVLVDDEALFAFYNERLPEMAWKDAQGSVWGSEDSVRIIESDKAERSSENERNEFRKNKRNGSRQNENHGNTVGWVENPTSAATAKTVGFDNPTYATQQPTPSPEREGRGEGKTVAAQTNFSATAANPLPQEREQSASASTFSDDLRPANLQQTAPSPVGEGWGEGKTVATQTNFSATSTNPLPQEREQSASASTFSDDLRPANLQQPSPSPVGEGWGEGKTVATQTNFSATTANPLPNPLPQEGEQSAAASAVSNDPQPQKQPAPQKDRLKPLPLADIRTFQAWLKTAERENPRLLFLSRDDLMQHAAAHITEEQFPKLLTVLNRLHAPSLEWLVPGMLREKIQLLIKALPKQIRRICVPVPDFITQFLSQNPDRNAPILPQLAQAIAKTAGDIRILEQINQDEWAAFRLPEHCYFNLRIIDDGGQELAGGRKLHELQQQLGQAAAVTFRDNTQEFERDNVTTWDIGTLPESIKFARGKQQLTGYLGLQKEKDGRIALRLCDTTEAAEQAHRQGVIELMKLQLKEQVKDLNKGIQGFTQAAMLLKHINADTLRDDLTQAVCDRAFIGEDELPRNEKAFKEQIKRARSRLPAVKEALSRYLQETAAAYAELNGKLGKHPLTHLLRLRLQTLLAAGFATRTPWAQWPRLPIYLKAMTLRLEKYSSNPARDAAREADIQELEQMWQEKNDGLVKQGLPVSDDLTAFKWMIEELRVSLFAQELKTPYPVSVKRLMKMWEDLN
ncbi:DUF3418 domain-containing protein [Neisseria meningitidis]|uniref:DUF3418 domain-containing protein n=1 Tax=Neisseria meningitidis TaxID=487 RepID=UPI000FCC953E|nr:DUF3418 domain-containing protein [Neisseria meningitidis]